MKKSRMINIQKKHLVKKMNIVLQNLKSKSSILVAMSGGVDSSVVALLTKRAVGDNAIAVTADSITLPLGELQEAKRLAKKIRMKHVIIKVDETCNLKFVKNPPDRCYYCKKELILKLKKIADENKIQTIVDGTNADDLKVHRPGALAIAENNVSSPLADAGLTKKEVRALAKMLAIPTAEKPSMACLASRFSYGEEITKEKMIRIAKAEKFVRQVARVKELRVRAHGNLARIEVGKDERNLLFNKKLLEKIALKLKDLGFVYVTMDLLGYRSGSMDEILNRKIIPKALKESK